MSRPSRTPRITPRITSRRRRLAALGLTVLLAPCGGLAQTEEVPFIVTPDAVTLAMLQLAGVKAGDHLIDLGSGDGRIVITAAKRFGASGLGVEIVPDLVAKSRAAALRAGVAARVRFEEQDLFKTDLTPASVITMYLLPDVNLQLRPALLALKPGTRLVSHDWDMGDWRPDRTQVLDVPDKPIGREKLSRLHLWTVPARLQGLWCAAGGFSLRLQQRHQMLEGTLAAGRDAAALAGRIDGAAWRAWGAGPASLAARSDAEDRFTVTAAQGRWEALRGRAFARAAGDSC